MGGCVDDFSFDKRTQLPGSPLTLGSSGEVFGVAYSGGTWGQGIVFELTPSNGNWSLTTLHNFPDHDSDGRRPQGSVVFDSSGNLYSTAYSGGWSPNCGNFGCGIVFELQPSNRQWKETILSTLVGGGNSGLPLSGLILDSNNNLFGTSSFGGNTGCGQYGYGCGTVFEVIP